MSRQELSTVMSHLGMTLTTEEIEVMMMRGSVSFLFIFREYWTRRMLMETAR